MENTSDLIAGAVSGLGYMFGGAYGEESFSWIQGGEPAGDAVQIPSGSTAAGAPGDTDPGSLLVPRLSWQVTMPPALRSFALLAWRWYLRSGCPGEADSLPSSSGAGDGALTPERLALSAGADLFRDPSRRAEDLEDLARLLAVLPFPGFRIRIASGARALEEPLRGGAGGDDSSMLLAEAVLAAVSGEGGGLAALYGLTDGERRWLRGLEHDQICRLACQGDLGLVQVFTPGLFDAWFAQDHRDWQSGKLGAGDQLTADQCRRLGSLQIFSSMACLMAEAILQDERTGCAPVLPDLDQIAAPLREICCYSLLSLDFSSGFIQRLLKFCSKSSAARRSRTHMSLAPQRRAFGEMWRKEPPANDLERMGHCTMILNLLLLIRAATGNWPENRWLELCRVQDAVEAYFLLLHEGAGTPPPLAMKDISLFLLRLSSWDPADLISSEECALKKRFHIPGTRYFYPYGYENNSRGCVFCRKSVRTPGKVLDLIMRLRRRSRRRQHSGDHLQG